mgnify:FL=1
MKASTLQHYLEPLPLRNLLNLCTELPDKGKEVKHAKGKSPEMFHNLLFKIQFHR